jgi:hypothetical protein
MIRDKSTKIGSSNAIRLISNREDETAAVIAELYGVSADYVRRLVNSMRTPKKPTTQKKARAIIKAYHEYKQGKTMLIKSIEKMVEIV